jgi:Holliday junction resolvase-like predicted endonuclease
MTPRQCEIAAESYTACLLAQSGYDVLVQYGANQPAYDLVAVKRKRILKISVKGSQDGGWMLSVNYKASDVSYLQAVDLWLRKQQKDIVFAFVQFAGVELGGSPRVYIARPQEVARQLKAARDGGGYGTLQEDRRRHHPKSIYSEKIPTLWHFSLKRIDRI